MVRPKTVQPAGAPKPALGPPTAVSAEPAFIASGPLRRTPPQRDDRPRRWLAIGLAGMVYVVGAAGLWSMYSTFAEQPASSLRPAGGIETMPPIEETIDVRDARLDGPIRPRFKPDLSNGTEEEVASSGAQKRI